MDEMVSARMAMRTRLEGNLTVKWLRATGAALAAASCAQAGAQTSEGALDAGIGVYGMRMYVDGATVKRSGALLQYELRGTDNEGARFSASVRVDCSARSRIEDFSTSWNKLGNKTSTAALSGELKPIYEGTRQSQELDRVCEFAASHLPLAAVAAPPKTNDVAPKEGSPQDAWTLFEAGLRAARAGDRAAAINSFSAGLQLRADARMQVLLANLLEAEGRDPEALVAWQRVQVIARTEEDKRHANEAVGRLYFQLNAAGKK
jgi:hypothetical protein